MNVEHEIRNVASVIGTLETADLLFKPKISPFDLDQCGRAIFQHLEFLKGYHSMSFDFRGIPAASVEPWAVRIYANTLAHLLETDAEIRSAYLKHDSILPSDTSVSTMFLEKIHSNFLFFMWLFASPTPTIDTNNLCLLKFVVLNDAIILEDISATREGKPGGWGWLDKSIAGVREIATCFEIRKIKIVATNERVHGALLKRGFAEKPPIDGLTYNISSYSSQLERID